MVSERIEEERLSREGLEDECEERLRILENPTKIEGSLILNEETDIQKIYSYFE